MKKTKYIAILMVFALGIASCSKDFLEVDPVGKLDTDIYYSTDEEVSLALTAAYDFLHSDQLQGWSSPFFIKQLPGDDTNAGGGGASDQPQYQDIDDFNWSPENAGIKSFFHINYYGIYRCNLIITNAASTQTQMIAEAKFLRAYYYSELAMAYGGVPLRLTPPETISEGAPRATREEVYAQIEQDLTEAIADLPDKNSYDQANKFRASKQAAQALLGKVHVYQEDWPAAITALSSVIATEGTQVGLTTNFADIFLIANEFGPELLLEASFVSEGKNWGNANWDRLADDNRHIQLQGPRDFVSGTSGILGGWGFNTPTRKLYNSFDPADPRRLLTVIDTMELRTLYGASTTEAHDTEGAVRSKLTTYATETNGEGGNTPELNYGTNWPLIRYADVLLLAAEAYFRDGQTGNALTEINKVRARAGATALTAITFDDIVYERNAELAYEGSRFWDLVRWGMASTELSDLGFVAGKHELFPIPLDELNNNAELSLEDQNPGY